MMPSLSANTQAILLLTAPLIAGSGSASPDLLSPGEYKNLARHLRDMRRQPADLLSPEAANLLHDCRSVAEETRLQHLLGRGFLLSQAVERWQSRAIWVASRADADYPRRLKARLREDAPAVLYGCGDVGLLETGGLAVVGSRNAADLLIDYTMEIGRLAARAGKTIVSGGARGIDQAAMSRALEEGGKVIGVLADSLEKSAMSRMHRNMLINGRLVLISPYDPSAGFNVGNAMQRNKLIYALSEAALVVSSDLNKGGTWAGATEQLDRLRMVPVYARSTGENSAGLDALRKKGAMAWPNPQEVDGFNALFDAAAATAWNATQTGLPLFSNGALPASPPAAAPPPLPDPQLVPEAVQEPLPPVAFFQEGLIREDILREGMGAFEAADKLSVGKHETEVRSEREDMPVQAATNPADALLTAVREVLQRLLTVPMKDVEVAAALEVSNVQAKTWLQRLVDEGVLEKHKKSAGYVVKQSRLVE
jgi:DNA processing protein